MCAAKHFLEDQILMSSVEMPKQEKMEEAAAEEKLPDPSKVGHKWRMLEPCV